MEPSCVVTWSFPKGGGLQARPLSSLSPHRKMIDMDVTPLVIGTGFTAVFGGLTALINRWFKKYEDADAENKNAIKEAVQNQNETVKEIGNKIATMVEKVSNIASQVNQHGTMLEMMSREMSELKNRIGEVERAVWRKTDRQG